MRITADLQDSVEGILNSKYGLSVAREFAMGRAIKKGLFRQSFFLIRWHFRIHFFMAHFHKDSASQGRGMFRSMPSWSAGRG